jgi:hypothetical protein
MRFFHFLKQVIYKKTSLEVFMEEKDLMQFLDYKIFFEENSELWVDLYKSENDGEDHYGTFSYLCKEGEKEEILKNYSWDLDFGSNYEKIPFKPILYYRKFYGIRNDYWEIIDELKLFFNLYEDKQKNIFYFIDENGDEQEVIRILDFNIKIKKLFLKEFLFHKKLVLCQSYDFRRFSEKTLNELGLEAIDEVRKESNFIYDIFLRDYKEINNKNSLLMIIGKRIISVDSSFKSIIFSEEEKFEEFIIGVDKNGIQKFFSCEEDKLSNGFGKNKGNPDFLTPVYFKKEVLDKYYSNPEKFIVDDGILVCGNLWSLRMDNNHNDIVMVWLGDLGRINYKEQKHWKLFNIEEGKISHTSFQRNFMGEFTDPCCADLYFKQKFKNFQKEWFKSNNWDLFSPLSKEDEHYFDKIRIPTKQSKQEFEELILAITKVMIDSLNVKELKKGLTLKGSEGSIEIFKRFLREIKGVEFLEMNSFLKDLQELRSKGVAHRKGSSYIKIKKKFGILEDNYKEVYEKILIECIKILNSLLNKKNGLV